MSQDVISFQGEEFHLADQMGLMPLMRFAKVAQDGVDAEDLAGLTAMYDLLEQCIDPSRYCLSCSQSERDKCCKEQRIVDDWSRFVASATKHRVQGDELMEVVKQAIEAMSARPTARSSVSSDGPPPTSPSSTESSSSPVVRRLEQRGRPDLALVVEESIKAQEARAS